MSAGPVAGEYGDTQSNLHCARNLGYLINCPRVLSIFGGCRIPWPNLARTAASVAGDSSNRLLLPGRRYTARPGLGPGLGQESEAGLAPREIDADIQQRIGTSAWAGKFHDRDDTVGLPGYEGHRPSRGVVRGGIDAENQIAGADSVAHRFHPFPDGKTKP